ncbi:uncharacterized protein LOC143033945 [Oratosquilla oratoria]|uniref:uncharacterized protein LOC143033945 n=1 Tax=Oratosquilla oratoria TaxID=337810 RepID=UPI003F758033
MDDRRGDVKHASVLLNGFEALNGGRFEAFPPHPVWFTKKKLCVIPIHQVVVGVPVDNTGIGGDVVPGIIVMLTDPGLQVTGGLADVYLITSSTGYAVDTSVFSPHLVLAVTPSRELFDSSAGLAHYLYVATPNHLMDWDNAELLFSEPDRVRRKCRRTNKGFNLTRCLFSQSCQRLPLCSTINTLILDSKYVHSVCLPPYSC